MYYKINIDSKLDKRRKEKISRGNTINIEDTNDKLFNTVEELYYSDNSKVTDIYFAVDPIKNEEGETISIKIFKEISFSQMLPKDIRFHAIFINNFLNNLSIITLDGEKYFASPKLTSTYVERLIAVINDLDFIINRLLSFKDYSEEYLNFIYYLTKETNLYDILVSLGYFTPAKRLETALTIARGTYFIYDENKAKETQEKIKNIIDHTDYTETNIWNYHLGNIKGEKYYG